MPNPQASFNHERMKAIERLIQSGYIHTPSDIHAMQQVPREEFLPDTLRERAYIDTPLPIGYGQTISALHMVGMMAEALHLSQGQIVLEVGSGSGYHAAVIAEIVAHQATQSAGHVYTLEIIPELYQFAQANLRKTHYDDRVTAIHSDGSLGLPDHAPFDAILVTAGAPDVPQHYIDQLAPGGRLVIPVGDRYSQVLYKITKTESGTEKITSTGCVFVPLIGKEGWND